MNFSRNEKWTESFMNDLVSSPKFAKDLTSIYADDIIQAVDEDKTFPTISAAIEDLRARTGLKEDQAIELRKVAAYTIDPRLYNSMENLETIDNVKLAKLLDAYISKCMDCTSAGKDCSHILSDVTKRAMKEVGIEKLSQRVETFIKAAQKEENKAKWNAFFKKANPDGFTGEQLKRRMREEISETGSVKKAGAGPFGKTDHHTFECTVDGVTLGADTEEELEALKKKHLSKKASTKKAWFQGSDESVDKIVSNDPNKLGYPKDVEYARQPMAVPVGGDSRDWEQSWFEGAANETKKVMGPSGAELKEKELWQRTAAWKNFMTKQGGGMNEGFKKYLEEQKAKKAGDKPDEETDKKDDAKEKKEASASACLIKKAELVFPQEVYTALQQMTGSKEQLLTVLGAMVKQISESEFSNTAPRLASQMLPDVNEIMKDETVSKWIVETIHTTEALGEFAASLERLNIHKSNWKVKVKIAALKQHANLLKAAEIAPNDINDLTEKAGNQLNEVATIIEDFKNSRGQLSSGEEKFIGEMATEYTNRLESVINDRGLASRIIDTIAKSADKATSLLYIINDLLQYDNK